tara:strand:- start:752 stop:910 length:159 start_codon:yes stop_codon:yes gene_type:complete
MAANEAINKMRYAPIPVNENRISERNAPNGPPRFIAETDCEDTLERLESFGE